MNMDVYIYIIFIYIYMMHTFIYIYIQKYLHIVGYIDETSPRNPMAAGYPLDCSKFQVHTDHWEAVETGNHLCCHIISVHSSTKW